MKTIWGTLCLALCLTLVGNASADEAQKKASLETFEEKLSYALGIDLGGYLQDLDADIDLTVLKQGLEDGFSGAEPQMKKEDIVATQQEFSSRQQEKKLKEAVAMVEKNSNAEEAFLKENGAKKGVITTESGLQYLVVKEGNGVKPQATDTVKVHYKGTLLDGTEFDSSYKRNEPATFPVNQVIPGWQEAIPLMSVGSTYLFYIPSKLAYGNRGAPPVIEPGAMLIFEVELLEIESAVAPEKK